MPIVVDGARGITENEGSSSLIVIVAERGIGFPNGTAETSRILGYARGLRANGSEARVLCLGTSEPSPPELPVNTQVRGVAGGIPFEYVCGSTVRSTHFWQRRWSRARGLLGVVTSVRRLRRAGPIEAVHLYSKSSLDAAVLHFVSRCAGAVYSVELCELPFHSLRSGLLCRLRRNVYDLTFFRWFDAAIVISARLESYAAAAGVRNRAILRAPVIVDTDEFRPAPGSMRYPPIVAYCGLLNEEKDGVVTLMRAFARTARDLPGIHLRLIGDAYEGTRIPEFRAIAERLGIAQSVSFLGTVPRRQVPSLLAQASVLVLARPRSPQADAGMPTKVAEYLSSGVPTILTRTGEIDAFLDNGVSAYLVPPDDMPAVATALREVLRHPEEAAHVGRRGREVALRNFDYRVVGSQVAAFFAALSAKS